MKHTMNARKFMLGAMLVAAVPVWNACNEEEKFLAPTTETITAKWEMPTTSQWQSFEFFDDQTYAATKRSNPTASAAPRTAKPAAALEQPDSSVIRGKYSVSGSTITLEGLGKVEVKDMTADAATFTFTPTSDAAAKYGVGTEMYAVTKQPAAEAAPSTITDGRWVCVEYDSAYVLQDTIICRDTFERYTYNEQRQVDTTLWRSDTLQRWQVNQRTVVDTVFRYDTIAMATITDCVGDYFCGDSAIIWVGQIIEYDILRNMFASHLFGNEDYCNRMLNDYYVCVPNGTSVFDTALFVYDSIYLTLFMNITENDSLIYGIVWDTILVDVDTVWQVDTSFLVSVPVTWDSAYTICQTVQAGTDVNTSTTTTLQFAKNGTANLTVSSDSMEYNGYYMYPYENTPNRISAKFYEQGWHYMGTVESGSTAMLLQRHNSENQPDKSPQRFVKQE